MFHHIRGNKIKKEVTLAELRKTPGWEDAHRYSTVDRIIKGLVGKIGSVEYILN